MQKREPLLIVRNERGPAVDYGVLLLVLLLLLLLLLLHPRGRGRRPHRVV